MEKTWAFIQRAVKTHDSLPRRNKFLQVVVSNLPYVHDEKDRELAYGYNEASAVPFRPTPRDMDNFLPVWGWLCWLRKQTHGKRDYKVIVARARDFSFKSIAHRSGRCDRTIERWFGDALVAIYAKFDMEIWSMDV